MLLKVTVFQQRNNDDENLEKSTEVATFVIGMQMAGDKTKRVTIITFFLIWPFLRSGKTVQKFNRHMLKDRKKWQRYI